MTITVGATYENGVLKLEQPVALEEHAKVRVTIETGGAEQPARPPAETWAAAERFIGFIKDADPSEPVAAEHDRYLYE